MPHGSRACAAARSETRTLGAMISDDLPTTTPADGVSRRARTTVAIALGSVACLVVGALAWAPWELRWNPDMSITLPTPEESETPTPPPTAPPETQPAAQDVVLWIFIVLGLVVLALVVAVAARAIRTWWSRRPEVAPDPPVTVDTLPGQVMPSREVVADAVAEALARLDGTPDPADAVVRAWLVLEEAVAREGVVRDAAQTQAELTRDVLHTTRAPREATTTLLRTYEAVRYGTGDVTPADVATARAALEEILTSLRRSEEATGA